MSKFRLVVIAGALSALALAVAALGADSGNTAAAPTAKTSAGRHGRHGGFGPMEFLARKLNLTDAQRQQIRTIMQDSRSASAPWQAQLEELRQQAHDSVVASGFDEGQIRALVTAKSPALVEMAVNRVQTLAKIRAVLTPDQQQRLEELRANRHAGPGGGPGGPDGPPGFGPGMW